MSALPSRPQPKPGGNLCKGSASALFRLAKHGKLFKNLEFETHPVAVHPVSMHFQLLTRNSVICGGRGGDPLVHGIVAGLVQGGAVHQIAHICSIG